MVQDAVANLRRQVQTTAVALERLDDAKRLLVVPEAPAEAVGQRGVERLLPNVAEGRVPEVVADRDRLGEIFVQAKRPRDPA